MITEALERIRAALSRQPRHANLSTVFVGGYTLMMKGVPRFDWRDTYHYVIALSWPRFLLLAFGAHIVLNICFALTIGLLFVRFSRPTARFRYATNAVIASHQGCPTLMIRIANGRRTVLYDASAHLGLLLSTRGGADGQILRRVHELRLSRSRLPMFTLAWTVMHRIDKTSPLNGFDAAMVRSHDARLLLGVAARDATLSAEVTDTKGYGPEDIMFGMRYIDVL